jgi:pullulanase/glycogen debranching enzyme
MMADETEYAFPLAVPNEFFAAHDGMTLRDWFASQALPQSVLDYDRKDNRANKILPYATKGVGTREEIIACQAYRYADAMLKARNRPNG